MSLGVPVLGTMRYVAVKGHWFLELPRHFPFVRHRIPSPSRCLTLARQSPSNHVGSVLIGNYGVRAQFQQPLCKLGAIHCQACHEGVSPEGFPVGVHTRMRAVGKGFKHQGYVIGRANKYLNCKVIRPTCKKLSMDLGSSCLGARLLRQSIGCILWKLGPGLRAHECMGKLGPPPRVDLVDDLCSL